MPRTITFVVFEPNNGSRVVDPTFVAGDIKLSVDGGAEANTTNLPTPVAAGYPEQEITITDAEIGSGEALRLAIRDQDSEWSGGLVISKPISYKVTIGGVTENAQAGTATGTWTFTEPS